MSRSNFDAAVAVESVEETALLYSKVSSAVERGLKQNGYSKTLRRVLKAIGDQPGRSDAEISIGLGMERSQLSRAMTRLLADGLVGTEPSPHHRGQRLCHLTESGMRVAAVVADETARAFDQVFKTLEPDDQRRIRRTIGELYFSHELNDEISVLPLGLREMCWSLRDLTNEVRREEEIVETYRHVISILEQQILLSDHGEFRWGLWLDHVLVGYCLLQFDKHDLNPIWNADLSNAKLGLLFVEDRYRGSGLGRRLLRHCIQEARRQGIKTITADVRDDQGGLGFLLTSEGFVLRPYSKKKAANGLKIVTLRKHLEAADQDNQSRPEEP